MEIHPYTTQTTSLFLHLSIRKTVFSKLSTLKESFVFSDCLFFFFQIRVDVFKQKKIRTDETLLSISSFNDFKISRWNLTTIIYIISIPALAHVLRLDAVRLLKSHRFCVQECTAHHPLSCRY